MRVKCDECDGAGTYTLFVHVHKCEACDGTGVVNVDNDAHDDGERADDDHDDLYAYLGFCDYDDS